MTKKEAGYWHVGCRNMMLSPSQVFCGQCLAASILCIASPLLSYVKLAKPANHPPIASVQNPANGVSFDDGEKVRFKGIAIDLEDGDLHGKSLVWRSDLDGYIGEGCSFRRVLSVGSHIITLTATDSGQGEGKDMVFIIVRGHRSSVAAKTYESESSEQGKVKEVTLPSIEFTYVPPHGSNEALRGKTTHANPEDFLVAVYAMVERPPWIKRFWWERCWVGSVATIRDDGTWAVDVGIDKTAAMIVAYLILGSYEPPLAVSDLFFPHEPEANAVAKIVAARDESGVVITAFPLKPDNNIQQVENRDKLKGVCFRPYRGSQIPNKGACLRASQLEEEIGLASRVATAIRTYHVGNTPFDILRLCEAVGIDCYAGVLLGKNEAENSKEIENIIRICNAQPGSASRLKALIVGNEVLLRNDMTEDALVRYVRSVKKSTTVPITTAELWSIWIEHFRLADEVDFLTVHIQPYWEGVSADMATAYVERIWKLMKGLFPDKRIVIGETGWPSKGEAIKEAIPSEQNQARFLSEFTELTRREAIDYFYFRLFDEEFNDAVENGSRPQWGIYGTDGLPKGHMKGLVPTKSSKESSNPRVGPQDQSLRYCCVR